MSTTTPPSRNLLNNRLIGGLMRSGWYPGILQIPTAAVFILIVWQLMLGPESAHDNLGTALTWVLWWPQIPIIFLLFGRFWCAICPFATLTCVLSHTKRLRGLLRPKIFIIRYFV